MSNPYTNEDDIEFLRKSQLQVPGYVYTDADAIDGLEYYIDNPGNPIYFETPQEAIDLVVEALESWVLPTDRLKYAKKGAEIMKKFLKRTHQYNRLLKMVKK